MGVFKWQALVWAFVSMVFVPSAHAQPPATILQQVIDEVRLSYNKQERPMVIFDLEGTLLDNRPRHLHILKEYAQQELRKARPQDAAKIDNLQLYQVQYLLTDTLTSIGVTDPAVVNNAAVFWAERFFKDEYLKHDTPTPGSVTFVRTLYSNGARIVYLTGRDQPRQLMGTIKALRDNGFPIGIQGTELIMKPTMQTQDAVFKQQVTNYLRHYGKVVASFDNEPANANVFKRAFADAKVIIYAAPHSPNPPPLVPGVTPLAAFQ